MKELIFSSLKKRKIQTISVVLVVAASTTLLFSLLLIYSGVSSGVTLSKERGGAELMLLPTDADESISDNTLLFTGSPTPVYMNSDVLEKAAKIDGVAKVAPQFFSQTIEASCCTTGNETRVIGFDPKSDWVVQPLTDCDLSNGLAEDEVLVGARMSDYGGDTISMLGKEYKIAGYLAETGSDIDLSLMVDIETARQMSREIVGYDHYWDKYGDPDTLVSSVLIDVDDSLSETEQTMVLRKLSNIDGVRVLERSSVIDSSQESLSSVFAVMFAAGILMLIVCILQLFSRYYSCVWERKSELALYRAVGATQKQLSGLIGGEAAILSGAGIVIGLVLGVILYFAGQAWLSSMESFPFVAPSILISIAFGAGVVVLLALVTLLSIIAPLRQLNRIDPSLAMQQSDID